MSCHLDRDLTPDTAQPSGVTARLISMRAIRAMVAACQVLSVTGGGDHLLVRAFAFGRIDNGVFTSLPGTSPGVLPLSAAW